MLRPRALLEFQSVALSGVDRRWPLLMSFEPAAARKPMVADNSQCECQAAFELEKGEEKEGVKVPDGAKALGGGGGQLFGSASVCCSGW